MSEVARARDRGVGRDQRRVHGIVHTPPLLARAVLWGLHGRLRRAGFARGLFSPAVTVVDPACGPGAFVAGLLALAAEQGQAPGVCWALDSDGDSVRAVAALCEAPASDVGCRLNVIQVDSLTFRLPPPRGPLVVLGNPPWAVAAARPPSAELARLLEDYRRDEHGRRLLERKLGVLSDAYVRFFRRAAGWVEVSRFGGGLGLITNGSFLDGPVHRGMRRTLLQQFDEVDVVDLGGSALLSRPQGGEAEARDENVFGVRPAVAVTWAVRRAQADSSEPRVTLGQLRSVALRGRREAKVLALLQHAHLQPPRAAMTEVAPLEVGPPLYLFVRKGAPGSRTYRDAISLAEAMPFHREGVQTNRDSAVVAQEPSQLLSRMRRFAAGPSGDLDLAPLERRLQHYDPERAREQMREALAVDPEGQLGRWLKPLAYRPFRLGYFVALPSLCHRPRPDLLAAMAVSPWALLSVRKDRGTAPYHHVAVVPVVADSSYLSARSSCRTRVFPLCTPAGDSNVDPQLLGAWAGRVGRAVAGSDFVDYTLSLLHSPRFTAAFAAPLRLDYARIPAPSDPELFASRVALGAALRGAYLDCVHAATEEGTKAGEPALAVGHRRYPRRGGLRCLARGLRRVQAADGELPDAWFGC